ncbi:maltoporin [Aquabacterium sp.]|uniref:maltoporin n=1 Tax=Aquabacterium sp. TaxID=1872578 RepID=UPI002C855DD5|nr:carbohydrate porin [Aquabacterium sp.]HSW03060.1 carbohydrate porin [Aquabacterium sp.]
MTVHAPRFTLLRSAAALALLATAGAAHAVDWTGYFRTGPGLTSASTSRACYGLNGGSSGMKYRLGNECDFYGEFQLSQGFQKDGIDYRATLMVNHYTGATQDNPDKGLNIEQMFAEAKGFDVAPNATFWIGKERGRRGDVHIVDTFFIEMLGIGAGFKGQPAGGGKLGAAFYKTDSDAVKPGNRINVEYVDLPANADGKLNFFASVTQGDFSGGKTGAGFTVRHDQAKLFGTGLSNTLWLQFAQGSAKLNGNFGDLTAGSKAKSWRIVESFNGQSGPLGGQAIVLFASEKNGAGLKVDSASVGGRVSYALTKNFKFVTELGVSQYKPQGGATARLTKLTIAPTLSVGPDFWSRPEFRLYATSAKWNQAAGNVTGQAALADKTSGTSYGAQVEWWF